LTLQERKVKLELEFVDLLSSWTQMETHEFQLSANQTTELLKIRCPSPPSQDDGTTASYSVVAAAKLLDLATGEVLSRFADWPQPFRHVDFPEPGIKLSVSGEEITVEVTTPVKALVLSADGDGKEVNWSDNALDVMPGDKQIVIARGLEDRAIKVAYMGKEIATKI
jgi:beta-mannosidase